MTTPNHPTPAQALELLAEYAALAAEEYALSGANPHDPLSQRRGERQTKGERHSIVALRLLEVQRQLRSLDPAHLRTLAAQLTEQQQELERLRGQVAEERWIPVSERLPEEGQHVIGWQGQGIEMVYLANGVFWDLYSPYPIEVTHWQPRPAPPQASAGGEG